MQEGYWTSGCQQGAVLKSSAAKGVCSVEEAAEIILQGGLVAYPTESCFGIGCDPGNINAIKRILELKKRPRSKGLIVIADRFERLQKFLLPLPDTHLNPMIDSWPGPYTWLCPCHPHTSKWLTGEHNTLAVRVTAHPIAARLSQRSAMAIVSTSANTSTRPALRSAAAVNRCFGDQIDAIVDGVIGQFISPSTITNAITGEKVRL